MAARRWIFAIQMLSAYGLRPVELLSLKMKAGKLWSFHIKRSGGGYGKPRELIGFHPEWARDWRLVERFKSGEELPKPYEVGAALNKFLAGKEYWEKLRKKKNVSSYSFRHSYSKRLHEVYGMDNKSASDLMGHSEEVHIKNYKDKWGNNKDSIIEKAMLYRDLHTKKGEEIASTV
jgi:integrase